jgi:hypothetical protein
MIKTAAMLILMGAVCACAQVVPSHDIPVLPDHINAGIEVGDTVEILTKDGEFRRFVVTRVGVNTIEGDSDLVRFGDITSLVLRSWEAPTHPCAVGVAVGCSVPEIVLLLSSEFKQQAEKFHPACVTHDFCYRHGSATYGATREECDTTFHEGMKSACSGNSLFDLVDFEQSAMCLIAADQTYNSVRRYGEKHYQTISSTYCEFREGP